MCDTPVCADFNFMISPGTGFAPLAVTGTFTNNAGFYVNQFNRGTGAPIDNPASPLFFTYSGVGEYT